MHEIETKLADLLATSEVVNVSTLGGIATVLSGWHIIAESRLADEFLVALVTDPLTDTLAPDASVSALYNQTLRKNSDPLVIRNVALQIAKHAPKLRGCFDTILDLLYSKQTSFARGQFLLAAFAIALLEKPKQYRLIAFLLEDREGEEESFLQYRIKTIGLSYSFFANEDLFSHLESFLESQSQRDELHFELGMAYLKKALDSDVRKFSYEYLQKAVEHFSNAEQLGRTDAACYSRLLSIVTQFSLGIGQDWLNEKLVDLENQLKAYAAYHLYRTEFGWANLRQKELMYWYLLCSKLNELSHFLGGDGWLNPILVIEDYLLQIYDVQRSILFRDNDGGINSIVRPEITKRMSKLTEKVSLLEQWIAKVSEKESVSLAKELLIEIERYKSGLLGNDNGTLSSRLIDTVPSITKLPANERNAFRLFVKERLTQENLKKDKILEGIFCELMDTFSAASLDTDSDIWFSFQQIVYYTLFFLKERMDNTVKNFPRSAYLFSGDDIPEARLQDDYYQNIAPLVLNCNVTSEQMDIGSGRADVFFRFNDFFIVAEIKREKRKFSMEKIAETYIGQTKEYQNTSAKLGVLLVLDLSSKPAGIGSIESQVRPFVISVDENGRKRGVVVFRIPGNRIKPSKIGFDGKL